MSYAKSYQRKKKTKDENHKKKANAYQPIPPFRTVEGIESEAWIKLDMGAIGVLMEFYRKFDGYNRYHLSLTYREAKNKMSSLIFTRWIWQLIGFGFIDVRRFGRLQRNCSLFGLSNRWRKLSKEPEKLDEVEKLLNQIETLKRQPGSQKKRMRMYKLRNMVLKV